MKNFCIEVNGMAIKGYQTLTPAYKLFLIKSRNKKNVVTLYELKSHALGDIECQAENYVIIGYCNFGTSVYTREFSHRYGY